LERGKPARHVARSRFFCSVELWYTTVAVEERKGHMDLYEQLVEMKLTIFERLAVIPQFPVLFDENDKPWTEGHSRKVTWSAYPDFLALDIREKVAYVVEVSKSRQSFKSRGLAERMTANRAKIERYLESFAPGFGVRWRFFVRRQHVKTLEEELSAQTIRSTVDALEDVFDKIKSVMP
jgi:hypothetical protein